MTDTNRLPDDLDSLKRLVLQRDAKLADLSLELHEAQRRLEQLTRLLKQPRQLDFPAAEGARVMFPPERDARVKSTPNFAGADYVSPQCTSEPR
jgi:hypothetical protein